MGLYRARDGNYLVGVCIQRMDLCWPIDDFLGHPVAEEILRFRETDHAKLVEEAL